MSTGLGRLRGRHSCPSRKGSFDRRPKLYLQEIARRRIHLSHEVDKLLRLIDLYGEAEIGQAIAKALLQRSFGARYVRALCDQARFARGLAEPVEPIHTGNPAADDVVVNPHAMETYDALFRRPGDPPDPDDSNR